MDGNKLFYGDNLEILRQYIPDESVDLIYPDPPFNSKRDYNVLFRLLLLRIRVLSLSTMEQKVPQNSNFDF